MALDIGSAGGIYVGDAGLDNLTAFTWLTWIYTDDSGTGPQAYAMKDDASGVGRKSLERIFGDVDDFALTVTRATTSAECRTTGVNKPINTWFFVAGVWLDADGGPRIYTGDLNTLATEASYSLRTNGSGTVGADSGDGLMIGARRSSAVIQESMFGKMGSFQVFDTNLSLNQIRAQQFNPHNTANCQLNMRMGLSGTTTQVDHSGNGYNGTVTNCTVADAVPLGPIYGLDSDIAMPGGGSTPSSGEIQNSIFRGVAQGVMRGAR